MACEALDTTLKSQSHQGLSRIRSSVSKGSHQFALSRSKWVFSVGKVGVELLVSLDTGESDVTTELKFVSLLLIM